MLTADQIRRIDSHFPVLRGFSEGDRHRIFSASQVVVLPKGQMLMKQNQQCPFIPLVLAGVLRIFKLSPNGREMTLYRIGSGETCLASIACQIKEEEFPALAQVEERAQLFMVPVGIYHDLLDQDLSWKDFLIVSLYGHMMEVMQALEAVAFDRTDFRLVQWLLRQTEDQVGTIHTTHEAIAIELGTAREVVSRLLGELKAHGMVSLGREKIEVLKPSLLKGLLKR